MECSTDRSYALRRGDPALKERVIEEEYGGKKEPIAIKPGEIEPWQWNREMKRRERREL